MFQVPNKDHFRAFWMILKMILYGDNYHWLSVPKPRTYLGQCAKLENFRQKSKGPLIIRIVKRAPFLIKHQKGAPPYFSY